jgi:hypothetical protein
MNVMERVGPGQCDRAGRPDRRREVGEMQEHVRCHEGVPKPTPTKRRLGSLTRVFARTAFGFVA